MSEYFVPDSIRPYLEELSDRLRSGHAAVMVGSGFSKNSISSGNYRSSLPDWNQLGDEFFKKLNGKKPENNLKYLNVLKLADEVQAAFGRPALNELLKTVVSDSDYEPSELHQKLLGLPWSDVFTTNYDTLLERARLSITSRRYDLVEDKEDLVYSEKPRIVKLHGSIPSGPFVITEEDYRRYPNECAPFVNTVHQSLLENTLCLIGFSGDDPNFFQWIGWIRDKFGQQNSPKMYLVGKLELTDAQKKLLDHRNIISVDLSAYQDIQDDHYKCLERFFDFLSTRDQEDNRLFWPDHNTEFSVPEKNGSTNKSSEIDSLVKYWKSQRDSYPRWVIIPEDRRNILWRDTFSWIGYISTEDELPDFLDLQFAFETNWRLDKCLCPIFNNDVFLLEAVLDKYKALLDVESPIESFNVSVKTLGDRGLDFQSVREMYKNLLLHMLRFYREEGRIQDWKESFTTIEASQSDLSPELTSWFLYERCLFALFELDFQTLNECISEWPISEYQPYWNAKKAGLLAEIGNVEEAKEILNRSLTDIRAKLNLSPVISDYALVSQESYVMYLLRWVQHSVAIERKFRESDFTSDVKESPDQYEDRWHFLKQYKCDPLGEMRILESRLDRPYEERREITITEEFDIGRITRIRHFGGFDTEAVIAYNFLRFCEEVGLPFRIPHGKLVPKAVENTIPRISRYSSYWAMVAMVRNGDEKAVSRVFNRATLSHMNTDFVDSLIDRYLKSLNSIDSDNQSEHKLPKENIGTVLARLVPEILSRLCCKCSTNAKLKLFGFLQDVYGAEEKDTYRGIKNLITRLFESLPVHHKINLISRMLDFPILRNLNPQVKDEFENPFLILGRAIEKNDDQLVGDLIYESINNERIQYFLKYATSSNGEVRKWAIHSIGILYELGKLSAKQQKQFTDALWSRLDEFGLPSDTDFLKSHFLKLPHPLKTKPINLIKEYLRSQRFSIQQYNDFRVYTDVIQASKSPDWSNNDSIEIFDRLIEWWDRDKNVLKTGNLPGFFNTVANESKANFNGMADVLTNIIEPDLNLSSRRETLSRVVSELQDFKCPALRLECACLHVFPDWRTSVFDKLERAIVSDERATLNDFFSAVLVLAERTKEESPSLDFQNILETLGHSVSLQKSAGLVRSLRTTTSLVVNYPWAYTDKLEKSTKLGLEKIAQTTVVTPETQDVFKKLEIRQYSARLAYKLYEYYCSNGEQIPSVITKWKSICTSDNEFAEIRNQWIN